jgi:signal peptidase I
MEPRLTDGQYVMVNKTVYLFHGPARGDVIVFHNPQRSDEDLVKRVIGLPGDTVTTDSTHVWVNKVLLNEKAYINAPANTPLNPGAQSWHIPPDQYFVLGDNRPVSFDSRYIGPIEKKYIVGNAALVFWPPPNIHTINTYSEVFSKIKNP